MIYESTNLRVYEYNSPLHLMCVARCVICAAEKDELLTAAVGEEAGDVEQLGLVPVAIAWLFRLVAAERERASSTSASTSTSSSTSAAFSASGSAPASSGAPAGDSRYSHTHRFIIFLFRVIFCVCVQRVTHCAFFLLGIAY